MDRQLLDDYAAKVKSVTERYLYIVSLRADDTETRTWLDNLLDDSARRALVALEADAVACPTCRFPLLLSPFRAQNFRIGIPPYCRSCGSGHQVQSEQDEAYTKAVMERLREKADNFYDFPKSTQGTWNWATSDSIKRKGFFQSMFGG
jgi:hypothetical protein